MGLSLVVGMLADLKEADTEGYEHYRNELEAVDKVLASQGLPAHHEPDDCPVFSCDMYGYGGLHKLRRVAAYLDVEGRMPSAEAGNASMDPVVQRYYALARGPKRNLLAQIFNRGQQRKTTTFNHLMLHSDAEGYYLPLDFPNVIFPRGSEIAGGMIGSVPQLLAECERLAAALEIPQDLDSNSPLLLKALESQGDQQSTGVWPRFAIATYSCVCLTEACHHSLRYGAAIVFS